MERIFGERWLFTLMYEGASALRMTPVASQTIQRVAQIQFEPRRHRPLAVVQRSIATKDLSSTAHRPKRVEGRKT